MMACGIGKAWSLHNILVTEVAVKAVTMINRRAVQMAVEGGYGKRM